MPGVTHFRALVTAIVPLLGWACGGTTSTDLVGGPTDVRCAVTLSPTEVPVGAARERASITVTAGRECSWTAVSQVGWISLATASGQGAGQIEVIVGENPAPTVRQGLIAVGDDEARIVQEAAPCSFRLSPPAGSVGTTGGILAVAVETFPGCAWAAASHDPWIAVATGAAAEGTGTVELHVAANTGPARQGRVTIGDQPFSVTQAADCSYVLSPGGTHATAGGGTAMVGVQAQPWCEWTAMSQVPWIEVRDGHGTGSGAVILAIAGSGGPPRSGGVTIAGQLHTVTQDGAPCTYIVTPLVQRVSLAGGTYTVAVETHAWCEWTGVSHDAWIRVVGGQHGAGSGAVTYEVEARHLPFPRAGTLTVAGHPVSVQQTFALGEEPSAAQGGP